MRLRPLTTAAVAACWAVFIAAIVWPTIALVLSSITQSSSPPDGFLFSARQWGLLWRSGGLAAAAACLCIIASIPAAFVVGQPRRLSQRPLIAACLVAALLCPPMVYAFGWERALPRTINPYLRCIGVWALWAWPIPAIIIGSGWSRTGRRAYEAALLSTYPLSAFGRAVLPALRRYVGLSALILFILFFGDYAVPHACNLVVYATDLLGWAEDSSRTIDTAWPAVLPATVTLLALLLVVRIWRSCTADEADDGPPVRPGGSPSLAAVAVACFLIVWAVPVGTLLVKLGSLSEFAEAIRTYGRDLAWSVGLAVCSGTVVMAMGLGLATAGALRRIAVGWAVAFGALPGALVGQALVAAYNHAATAWIYDYWPIVALSYVSRFAWVGVVTGMIAAMSARGELAAQARTDGADEAGVLGHLVFPMGLPLLLGGVAVTAALSLAEVAGVSPVRVPSFTPVAVTIIEKFHRFEDGMLISLSMCLVLATLPGVLLLTAALRLR